MGDSPHRIFIYNIVIYLFEQGVEVGTANQRTRHRLANILDFQDEGASVGGATGFSAQNEH
jgi:hypothetical protein